MKKYLGIIYSWLRSEEALNCEEYLQIPKWAVYPGFLGQLFFWWFLPFKYGFIELHAARLFNALVFILFPLFIQKIGKYYRKINRVLWFLFCTWHFSIHPWLTYKANNYNPYWLASLAFFGATTAFALRSLDVLAVSIIGASFAYLNFGSTTEWSVGTVVSIESAIASMFGIMYFRHAQQKLIEAKTNLAVMLEQIRSFDQQKDDFISKAAHEMRTPIAIALAVTDRIPSTIKEKSTLLSLFQHLKIQINVMLNIKSMVSSNDIPKKTDVQVTQFFTQISNMYRALCSQKNIALKVVIRNDGMMMHVDEEMLYVAVTNLLNNAVKHTQKYGYVHLVISAGIDDVLTISVKDSGIGICADEIDKIFDRYYKASNTVHTDGIGLGLFVVKSIVEAHNGTIRVDSTLNAGSNFVIKMPCGVRIRPASRPAILADQSSSNNSVDINDCIAGTLYVCLIEDNLQLRIIIRIWLEHENIAVISFANAKDAIKFIGVKMPALTAIVTDVSMPNIDGIEAVNMIRSIMLYSDIPVLFCTGFAASSVKARLTNFIKFKVIEKPFDRHEFIGQFRSIISLH